MFGLTLRISYSRFRCINHKLPFEKGRFKGIVRGELTVQNKVMSIIIFLKKGNIPVDFYKKHNTQKYHDLFTVSE